MSDAEKIYPDDDEVIANATAAIAEIARHVDHQSHDAESVDTKAAAILTVTAAALPIVVTRVGSFDTDLQRLASGATIVASLALVLSLFHALRPRGVFSYGPEPKRMAELMDRESRKSFTLWMADSYAAARLTNVAFLDAKQDWYQRALRCLIATGLGVAWMVQSGVIK